MLTRSSSPSALDVGQLVKEEWFTLFEAVSALEIMDPKMDSGYLAPGESLLDEYDVTTPLSSKEVIGIMDQLLCYEMAWQMGSPMSQTLFTSLYLDRLLWPEPKSLDDAHFSRLAAADGGNPYLHLILRAYCLALIKCCHFVHERIAFEQTCYEEEDFVTQLYSCELLPRIATADLQGLLQTALTWVEEHFEGSKMTHEALIARLSFRMAFLSALESDGNAIATGAATRWTECASFLNAIQATTDAGQAVPAAFSVKIQRKLASTVPPRPIVKITFDRALAHVRRLCQDGSDMVRVFDFQGSNNLMTFLWTFQSRSPQPSVYIRSLLQSSLLTQSKVSEAKSTQELLYDDLAETVLPGDILLDRNYCDVEMPGDPRFEISERMGQFVAKAQQPYLDIVRCICQNRARIRRTLCHAVQIWDDLQLELEPLDKSLQTLTQEQPIVDPEISAEPIFSFPLSSWAYHHKLRLYEWIIQLGFELDIYQADELAGMYWQLQYVARIRTNHLERIRGFVTRKLTRSSASVAHANKDAYTKALSYIGILMLDASAKQHFANGLSCLYTTLNRHQMVQSPPRPYSNDTLRYELRMKPFLHLSLPELLPYEQFQREVSQLHIPIDLALKDMQTPRLMQEGLQMIQNARRDLEVMTKMDSRTTRSVLCHEEWRGGVRDTLRACIGASIAGLEISRILHGERDASENAEDEKGGKGGKEGASTSQERRTRKEKERKKEKTRQVRVEPSRAYHRWWLVPKLENTTTNTKTNTNANTSAASATTTTTTTS
ncbi:MAG: hypothetical protein M1838_002635 [Thelocarpon superellum]|nr:MAG: hypothetical protein M1838_002635 [Thelocarpon superellum]